MKSNYPTYNAELTGQDASGNMHIIRVTEASVHDIVDVPCEDFQQQNDTVIIESNTGTGKTTWISNFSKHLQQVGRAYYNS